MMKSSTDFGYVVKYSEDERIGIIERRDDGKLYYFDLGTLDLQADATKEITENLAEGAVVHFEPILAEESEEVEDISLATIIYVYSEREPRMKR